MKEKSRTRIPKQSARNLIGVVDEYGVLVIKFLKEKTIFFLFSFTLIGIWRSFCSI